MIVKTGLDAQTMETAVLGGAVLGCGGGGKLEDGLYLGEAATALSGASLVEPGFLSAQTLTAVVMPVHTSGSDTLQIHPSQTHRAVAMLQNQLDTALGGLINGGWGAVESMIGWELAGFLGVPLLNGGIPATYHPISLRNLLHYWVETAASETFFVCLASPLESDQESNGHLWRGRPAELAQLLAKLPAVKKATYVAAAGPMLPAALAQEEWPAPVSHALQVGQAMLAVHHAEGEAIVAALQGIIPCHFSTFATVTEINWFGQGQDAYGEINLLDVSNRHLRLTYSQRYRKFTVDGQQLAAFPDLIITLGILGTPLTGEEVFMGQDLYLMVAS